MKTIRTFHRSVLVLSILLMAFTFEAGAQPGKSFNGNDFSSNKSSNTIGGTNLSTGLKSNVELAFGWEIMAGKGEYPYLGVTYSLGYQCNPYFYIGGLLGTGFPNYFIFAADCRAYFTKTKTAPFISTQLGFTYSEACDGPGVFFSFGPGVRFSLAKKMGLSLYPSIKLEAGEDLGLAIALNVGFDF